VKYFRVPFTVLLPLLSLLSWVGCVAVPATFYDMLLTGKARLSQDQRARFGGPAAPIHQAQILAFAAGIENTRAAYWLNGINLPAIFVELPIDRCLPDWPDTWYPPYFTLFSWRALTFPLYSIPFWWFAGLGMDAVFGRRNSRWPVLTIGTVVFTLFLVLCIGLTVTRGVEDDPAVTRPILAGCILWPLLFSAFPIAWIRKGLNRRASQLRLPN
jgi:hypothetical protein